MAKTLGTAGLNIIKDYEGLKLDVYADAAGFPTVGYGHLLSKTKYDPNKNLSKTDANKELKNAGLSYTSPITKSQAETLLKNDIKTAETKVNNLANIKRLTQSQFDALTSLTFNAPDALPSDDMKALLKCPEIYSDFVGAIRLSLNQEITIAFTWTIADGVKLNGLVRRRNAEAALFCKGMRYWYNEIK